MALTANQVFEDAIASRNSILGCHMNTNVATLQDLAAKLKSLQEAFQQADVLAQQAGAHAVHAWLDELEANVSQLEQIQKQQLKLPD